MAAILSSAMVSEALNGLSCALHPYAYPALTNFANHIEFSQSADHPIFEAFYEFAHVASAFADIQQYIYYPLSWAMVGILPAALRLKDWEAIRVNKIVCISAAASGIKWRMFQ